VLNSTVSNAHHHALARQVLEVSGLAMSYGERQLFQGLSFTLPAGAILGVIGSNGTGKTSLLRLIAGDVTPDEGSVRLGPSVQLGYASQTRDGLEPTKSVYQEISQGLETITVGGQEVSVRAYVAAFNLRGPMQEKLVGSLSGGERGRVHLAKTLREGCNLLLLDEPTNDLDVDTLRSLEEALVDFAGSAVIVSHDRWFLDRVCTHTLSFESDGAVEFFEGSLSDYSTWKSRHRK
jgi:ATPase subunit of ABC transporter with duplicated ATPase domains